MSVIIGVDLGGTNMRAGAVVDGDVVRSVTRRSSLDGSSPIETMRRLCLEAAGGEPIAAVGIAASGPLDLDHGIIANPYTLPDRSGVPLRDDLAAALDVPVTLENDTAAAALAEWRYGAGRGTDPMALVTFGTGIGTALVIDGDTYRGYRQFHPEAGHHLLESSGIPCYCGQQGCWESLASGTAFTNASTAAPHSDPTTVIGRRIGRGLLNVYAFWAPEVVVVGGGLAARLDRLLPAIHEAIDRAGSMLPPCRIVIQPAALPEPGVVGAAIRARQLTQPGQT